MQPPDLESAVATIRQLKEQEMADEGSSPDSGSADALAKFLLLHVDAEQVRPSRTTACVSGAATAACHPLAWRPAALEVCLLLL